MIALKNAGLLRPARFLGVIVLLVGCDAERTELVVVVDTDLAIPSEVDALNLEIVRPNGETIRETQPLSSGSQLPPTLFIEHDSGDLNVTVTATALKAGVEVVQQTFRTSFTECESRVLIMRLRRSCVGRTCEPNTCVDGMCQTIEVPPSSLDPWTGTPGAIGTSDAAIDAPVADAPSDVVDAGVDSDGSIDACPCMPGTMQPCTTGCGSMGMQTCQNDCTAGACIPPADDTCNNTDEDCDGVFDEAFPGALPLTLDVLRDDDTCMGGNVTADSCHMNSVPELIYRLVLATPTNVDIESFGPTLISYRGTHCPGSSLICDEANNVELAAGTHYFVASSAGAFCANVAIEIQEN